MQCVTRINVNDRICQFRIQKHQPVIRFEETDTLGNENRGGIEAPEEREEIYIFCVRDGEAEPLIREYGLKKESEIVFLVFFSE